MKKSGLFLYLLLFLSFSFTISSQETAKKGINDYKVALKVELFRTLFKQPRISLDYKITKNISAEISYAYCLSGKIMCNNSNSLYSKIIPNVGPAKGYNFSLNCNKNLYQNKVLKLFVGLGYFYSYSSFKDYTYIGGRYIDGADGSTYRIKQSESAVLNAVKVNSGFSIGFKSYSIEPYYNIIMGMAICNGTSQKMGAYYSGVTYPPGSVNDFHEKRTKLFSEFGIRFCFHFIENK